VKAWVSSILRLHLPHNHNFEVAWCLVAAGVLRIKLDPADIPLDGTFPGSVVLSLFGLLRERGLLDIPLSKWNWRARIHREGVLGENWLFAYEAVRRKWTSDRTLKNAMQQHPILALALSENVAFLEEMVLDAKNINLSRRVFSPKKASSPQAKPNNNSKETFVYQGEHSISELYEGD
jgi:hypothetical protein